MENKEKQVEEENMEKDEGKNQRESYHWGQRQISRAIKAQETFKGFILISEFDIDKFIPFNPTLQHLFLRGPKLCFHLQVFASNISFTIISPLWIETTKKSWTKESTVQKFNW